MIVSHTVPNAAVGSHANYHLDDPSVKALFMRRWALIKNLKLIYKSVEAMWLHHLSCDCFSQALDQVCLLLNLNKNMEEK